MIVLRSLLFNILFFGWLALASVGLVWVVLLPRPVMMVTINWFLGTIAFLERVVLGLRYEVRGLEHLPRAPYLVAAKHQSAWETMKLHLLVPDPAVVLKRELTKVPLWGWFASKTEQIPVDRGARGRAIASLLEGAQKVVANKRPIVIFPQGTRVAPGSYASYRVGIGVLYEQLHLPIVPMALNSGLYWSRRAFIKRPGTIIVEFLPPIEPGLQRYQAMAELESRLESATDRLVVAAGGPPTIRPRPRGGRAREAQAESETGSA